jgi:hypothetical protein
LSFFRIDHSDVGLTRLAFEKARRDMPGALRTAINRTGDMAFTKVRRIVSKETGIPQRRLTEGSRGLYRGRSRKRDEANFDYVIAARGPFTPLSYFQPVQRRAGVSARAWGKRRILRGTFLATMRSGHVGVFKRVKGSRRLKELWGPSLPREMLRGEAPEAFRETFRNELAGKLAHEVRVVLLGLNKRARMR